MWNISIIFKTNFPFFVECFCLCMCEIAKKKRQNLPHHVLAAPNVVQYMFEWPIHSIHCWPVMALQSFWPFVFNSVINSYRKPPHDKYMNVRTPRRRKWTQRSIMLLLLFFQCVSFSSSPTMSKIRCPMTLIQSIEWYFNFFFLLFTKVPWPCAYTLNQLKNDL